MMDGPLGLDIKLALPVDNSFSESQSRFVVTVQPENQFSFEQIVEDAKLIGKVTEEASLKMEFMESETLHATQAELTKAWKGAIPCLLKSKA